MRESKCLSDYMVDDNIITVNNSICFDNDDRHQQDISIKKVNDNDLVDLLRKMNLQIPDNGRRRFFSQYICNHDNQNPRLEYQK